MRTKKSDKTLRSINLDSDTVTGTLKLAKRELRSFSNLVNWILKNYIKQEMK